MVSGKSTSKGLVFKIQRGAHFGVFTKLPRLLCWGITQQNDIPRYAQIRGNDHRMATLRPGPAGGVTSRSTTRCPGRRFAAGETLWPGMWGEDAVRRRSGSPLRWKVWKISARPRFSGKIWRDERCDTQNWGVTWEMLVIFSIIVSNDHDPRKS